MTRVAPALKKLKLDVDEGLRAIRAAAEAGDRDAVKWLCDRGIPRSVEKSAVNSG